MIAMNFPLTLLHPTWLVLLVPLAAAVALWRAPSPWLTAHRIVVMTLAVLAAAGPAVLLPSREGTVVVVADRSRSMPETSDAQHLQKLELVQKDMGNDDKLAVISFGAAPSIEQAPQARKFSQFTSQVGPDASDLAGALDLAVALIPPDAPGRVLVLSDGRWTGRNPMVPAARAAAREVAVDFLCIERPMANDVAIARIDAPAEVTPGEAFMLTAQIRCPRDVTLNYRLMRGEVLLAEGSRAMPAGVGALTFRDAASAPGTQAYRLTISSDADDPVSENNSARLLIGVRGPKDLLVVSPDTTAGLAKLLAAGKLSVKPATPAQCRWSLEDLSQYSAVLIENTPADELGTEAMTNLAAWVAQTGSGLMMTGGRSAYAPGGYFQSPLDPVLPVSMELRREHRKLSVAMAIVLDRSGSMSMSVPGGRTKIDLANAASAEVVNLLSPMDQIGVIAVDSAAHTIVSLTKLDNKPAVRSKILKIDSQGGGIFVYEGLSAAAKMLAPADTGTRHIILFADAADSEEPGDYVNLLSACRKAGITCSVIGLGTKSDPDAKLLQDIAKRGGGRCFFTDRAQDLPRLFAQDTFVVARSTFIDEPTAVRNLALAALTGQDLGTPPPLGGYNLCYLRPGALASLVTVDEYKAPVVASWQAGIGRVLCYTGQANGKFTGPVGRWDGYGSLLSSLARWTSGEAAPLPQNMLLTQTLSDAGVHVRLHLDPELPLPSFTTLPAVRVLRGLPGQTPTDSETPMAWLDPETLGLDVPLSGTETAICTVQVPLAGAAPVALPPVCLLYSPEFRPPDADKGRPALEQLARITAGTERLRVATIWQALPRRPRLTPLATWFFLAAAVLLLLEVFERRTGLLSSILRPRRSAAPTQTAAGESPRPTAQERPQRRQPPTAPGPPAPSTPVEDPSDINDAFRKARRKANRRTDRANQ